MKKIKALLLIAALWLSPIVPLYFYFRGNLYNLNEAYSLGMFFGILAFIYFLNGQIMALRVSWLENILGQDRLILVHRLMSEAALILSFFHRKFKLEVFTWVNGQMRLGQAALFLIVGIVSVTLLIMVRGPIHRLKWFARFRTKIEKFLDFNLVRTLHNGLVFALLLASVHVVLASSTAETWGRTIVMGLWSATALILWVNHKIIRPLHARKNPFKVVEIHRLKENITHIVLEPPRSWKAAPVPGQFAFFSMKLPGKKRQEHPFSISSSPDDKYWTITTKTMGDFTSEIHRLKPGDSVQVQGPLGRMQIKEASRPLVMIAGGIGITPFLSYVRKKGLKDATLFWSLRKEEDLFFKDELYHMEGLKFIPLLSNQGNRLTADTLMENLQGPPPDYDYYICGPHRLMKGARRYLRSLGVKRKHIISEDFGLG